MKLYVWSNPYEVCYGNSMIFAVAESEEQAKEIAAKAPCYIWNQYDNGNSRVELGKPFRIVELPCAEWHEWHE